FVSVYVKDVPWVPSAERVTIEPIGNDCWRVSLYFGFMDQPDVSRALLGPCGARGLEFDMMQTSFFVNREIVIPVVRKRGMALWRERLFAAMSRNARGAMEYFNIPANRVIELGTQIEL
ncbi:MAG TPA: potassium transporter Kup, partial [Burkholderiales bacterium]|nr:potassium transporter Kup [Burkholderiales bacterium]